MLSIPSGKLDATLAAAAATAPWAGPASPLQALSHDARRLWRYLLLALLLHLGLLLLLGNAPGGTARDGEGVWGAINVTLRGPDTSADAVPAPSPPLPETPAGPRGDAPQPRWGGAVRSSSPPTDAPPGAAQLGTWAAQPEVATQRDAVEAPSRIEPDMPAAAAVPIAPAPAPVVESAAPPAAAVPAEPEPRLLSSPLSGRSAMATDVQPLQRAAPVPAPKPLAFPQMPDLAPAPPPAVVPAVVPAAPAALPPMPAPAVAPQPAPEPPVPVAAPVAAPVAPATTPGTAAPAPPAIGPSTTAAPQPSAATPAARATTTSTAAPAPAAPMPAASPAPGLPDAGQRIGQDIATPPSAAASAVPRLNLQLARPRGGELSRGISTGALPVLPRPPELPDKLAKDIEKAGKADCRTAYAGAGLLAVVPLAVQAVRQEGCKW